MLMKPVLTTLLFAMATTAGAALKIGEPVASSITRPYGCSVKY